MNQNNINDVNQSVNNTIPPINEVKIEEEKGETVVLNDNQNQNGQVTVSPVGNTGNQNSNEPPKNSNVSTILLILLFIFLFAYIMGMPYINQFIQDLTSDTGLSKIEQEAKKEEEKQKQEEEQNKPTPTPDDEKTKELVCTSTANTNGNYTLVQIQKFYYNSKNKILSSKLISQYSFNIIDDSYNSLKLQCDNDSLKYLTHEGYTMACSYGENNIEISHEFDLKTFTPIVDGMTNIQANATYQQDLNTVKNNLISQGYTCE